MRNPKISVIVPVYNAEKYLKRCIDSILSQTFADFELLLIDDGSTDSSGIICDEYAKADARTRAFHKENGGVSSARNLGLENACGQYLAFADSDDWVDSGWLEDFMAYIGEYDILFQHSYWHNPNGTVEKRDFHLSDGMSYREKIIALYPTYTIGFIWATFFKMSIVNQFNIRFNEQYTFKEDRDFTLRYCKHARSLKMIEKRNYHYYIPPAQSRNYMNPSLERIQLEINEKSFMNEIVPRNISKDVVTDLAIIHEFLRFYSSTASLEEKQKALGMLYDCRPLEIRYSQSSKIHYLTMKIINVMPQSLARPILESMLRLHPIL